MAANIRALVEGARWPRRAGSLKLLDLDATLRANDAEQVRE